MANPDSISQWIEQLKSGEANAAQQIWNRFSVRLINLAEQKLKNMPKRVVDEEDIVQSVFRSICRGAEAGRFENVRNRDDLWWMMLAITKQKVVDHVRRETAKKRGSGRVQTETGLELNRDGSRGFSLDHLLSEEPSPEFLVCLEEQNQLLLGRLRDDKLRQIAVSRIEGYTVPEIAAGLAVSTRSIERKLQLIRSTWAKELSSVD